MHLAALIFLAAGISVVLPLGARIAGNLPLARRLDLVPLFTFAAISLAFALAPDVQFSNLDLLDRETGPASPLVGRIVAAVFGLLLIAVGISRIRRNDFHRPDDDEED